jgi:putative transposase
MEFRLGLGYKLDWNGGMLLAVPPHHASDEYAPRGYTPKDNRRTQEKFVCVARGYENHADVVGAINVLARGHRVLARGETAHSGRSRPEWIPSLRVIKQEHAKATMLELARA